MTITEVATCTLYKYLLFNIMLIAAHTGQPPNSVLRLDFWISGFLERCLLAVPSPRCVKSLIGDDYFYCCFARSNLREKRRLLFSRFLLLARGDAVLRRSDA